ncbi:glycosyltransferase family 2 protein [Paraglaciecola sp.]|uniref:glycosyltransferase n=1 Tax=Paraglaciecola sp. TaxID=1920173 RepID=UPI00273F86CC|nr:glycosyltransferase family 2 protein [Paraglaciecola sp.]MDP5029948.1 glycosyltransferase [Paraglaciecola sp.]
MKKLPLVSVILPVYNVELYLAECLDSVLKQNYPYFELIAVNDGSTDQSLDILLAYRDKFEGKLVIIEQTNKGLSAARNTGLENAKGEFIYFLDSDDWILPNTLDKCINELVKTNADLVIFNAKAFCDDMPEEMIENFDYSRNLPADHYTDGHQLFVDSRNSGFYIVQSCCYMYRFKHHSGLRFIDGILHEDNYFTTMLFLTSSNIRVLQDRFFQRRIRKNSITTSSLSMRHASGYYKSVVFLADELSKKAIHSADITQFLHYMIQVGFEIERELSNGSVSFNRKFELIKKFKSVVDYKITLRILLPSVYYKLLKLFKKI